MEPTQDSHSFSPVHLLDILGSEELNAELEASPAGEIEEGTTAPVPLACESVVQDDVVPPSPYRSRQEILWVFHEDDTPCDLGSKPR